MKYTIKTMNGEEAKEKYHENKEHIIPKNRPIEKHFGSFNENKKRHE